jgi:hypothetical protein
MNSCEFIAGWNVRIPSAFHLDAGQCSETETRQARLEVGYRLRAYFQSIPCNGFQLGECETHRLTFGALRLQFPQSREPKHLGHCLLFQ